MTFYLLLLYPAIILFLSLYRCKFYRGASFYEDCFGIVQAKNVQAIACLFVVLHHLTQIYTGYGDIYRGPITILSSMGILFTSIFFFFSGYGLIVSFHTKESYLSGFLKHRLTNLLIPFFVANILSVLIRVYISNVRMSGLQVIKCISGLVLINGNGWYIVEIFFLYIAFYVLFKYIKNEKVAIIILCVFTLFLIYVGYVSGHSSDTLGDHWFKGEWWYNSTIVFVFGLMFARFREQITLFIRKRYYLLLTIFSILFVTSFYIEEIIRKRYGYYRSVTTIGGLDGKVITLISQSTLCLIFVMLILLLMMKVSIGNKLIKFISPITMEIFLIHGLFINNIPNLSRKNAMVAYALVIILGITAAYVVHIFDQMIIKKINSYSKKRDYLRKCEKDLIRDKKEKKLKTLGLVVVAIASVIIIVSVVKLVIIVPHEYKAEINNLELANVNDTVKYGRYEINPEMIGKERVEWIVIKKEENRIMLLCKKGIESQAYHSRHAEVSWEQSELYKMLNDEFYEKTFSEYEKNNIIPNPETGEKVSLLSPREAIDMFKQDIDRQLLVTTYAEKKGVNINTKSKIYSWDYKDYRSSWWWLKGTKGIMAPFVTPEGVVDENGKYVNKPNGAVRPVIWVEF